MSKNLLANRKPIEILGSGAIIAARKHIATALWKEEYTDRTQVRMVHWTLTENDVKADPGAMQDKDSIMARIVERGQTKNNTWRTHITHGVIRHALQQHEMLWTTGNKDDRIAIVLLTPGNWLTCTVIDRHMRSFTAVVPPA